MKATDIAVIGMSGCFPDAANLQEYWENIRAGRASIRPLDDQTILDSINQADTATRKCIGEQFKTPHYVKKASLLKDDVALFDAAFFGFNPNEAELLDPQQRKFLELAWEALEHAGVDPARYAGLIGVYAGTNLSRYFLINVWSNRKLMHSERELLGGIGNEQDYVSNRVSYKLDLKGPAVTVQSACSTSLVAVHMACQSLLNGECDMALGGGIRITVPHKLGYMHNEGDMSSPDGEVRAFDAGANGTVFGRGGGGCVLLKRLEDAQRDGDTIHAIIKGTAINNDGANKAGYTAPSVEGQMRVVAEALAMAEVEPESITYIEAHGTGTPLGDPIEVSALSNVYGHGSAKKQYCAIGSVKTNVGHLAEAAGIAALLKAILCLQHKELVPSLNYSQPNPRIDFANSPFYVNTELRPWSAGTGPRRAGVSAFGVGGTNAHVILQEAPEKEMRPDLGTRPQVLVVSAKTESALTTSVQNLAGFLQSSDKLNLEDVAFTLHAGRRRFEHRLMTVADTVQDAAAALATLDPKRVFAGHAEKQGAKPVFMFSGQGSQHVGMARELYQQEPVFKETLDRACEILKGSLGCDLRATLYPQPGEEARAAEALQQTGFTQPALFVVEYALAQCWMHYGVFPEAMIGHSIGEYVAACVAGVFTLPEALALVALRGKLMQGLPAGAMLSVAQTADACTAYLGEHISLATVNSPDSCVLAGSLEAMAALEKELASKSVACRRLHTSHAFHSWMMEPILETFRGAVSKVALQAPNIPFISNVSKAWITPAEATSPDYWVRHLRQTVYFSEGLQELMRDPKHVYIEVGPSNVLSTLARRQPKAPAARILASLPHPNETQSAYRFFLTALGRVWLNGVEIEGSALGVESGRRIPLPTYPFERRRFWVDAKQTQESDASRLDKKSEIGDWFYQATWKQKQSAPVSEQDRAGYQTWMIFNDDQGLGEQLRERLSLQGCAVVVVNAGEAFAVQARDRFTVRPDQPDDYRSVLEACRKNGLFPQVIVHAWLLTGGERQAGLDYFKVQHQRGYSALMALAQAVGMSDENIRLGVVTNRLADVLGNEVLEPEKATVLGPVKVIGLEYPNLACAALDLLWTNAKSEQAALVTKVMDELTGGFEDRFVAWRHHRRWVLGYEPLPLGESLTPSLPLREKQTILITGGMGGLGLVQAQALAGMAKVNLVLLGRTPMPPKETWSARLKNASPDNATAQKIKAIQALEAQGAQVMTLAANVVDRADMARAVAEVKARFGAIHGVIHSAGMPGGGLIQLKTQEQSDTVILPKVQGVLLLKELLKGEPLEFMVLNSSLFAITGGFGQVDYCAANNFLDLFAKAGYQETYQTLSLNWDAWEEIGMAVKAQHAVPSSAPAAPAWVRTTQHPLLQGVVAEDAQHIVFLTRLRPEEQWVVREHRIHGQAVIPGTAYLEMARAAWQEATGEIGPVELRDVFFMRPAVIPEPEGKDVRVTLEKSEAGYRFTIASQPHPGAKEWETHAMGTLTRSSEPLPTARNLKSLASACAERVIPVQGTLDFLSAKDKTFLGFGRRWENVRTLRLGQTQALFELELPAECRDDLAIMGLHPALLDMSTGPTNGALLGAMGERGMLVLEDAFYLPLSYARLSFLRALPAQVFSHSRCLWEPGQDTETLYFDITLLDASGQVLVAIERFALKRVPAEMTGALRPAAVAPAGNQYLNTLFSDTAKTVGIFPAEGKVAFERVWALLGHQAVAVCTSDLNYRIEKIRSMSQYNSGEEQADEVSHALHPRPELQTLFVAPRNELEEKLAGLWQAVLGLEKVGIHDNFFELGADSVLGIQYISRAKEKGISLLINQLFERPTIAELAQALGEGSGNASSAPAAQALDKELDEFEEELNPDDVAALLRGK